MSISDRLTRDAPDYDAAFFDAIESRYCARPVAVGNGIYVRCQSRLKSVCPSCSEINRGDWAAIARSGVFDADGNLAQGFAFFLLTLTAPSFGKVNDDGSAVDPSPYDYLGQVEWNSTTGRLWNATLDRLKRALPGMSYFAVREAQKRGALHFHVILRVPLDHTPEFAQTIADLARASSTSTPWGTVIEWGTQGDCRRIGDDSGDTAKTLWYLSKALQYTVKDVDSDGLDPDRETASPAFEHSRRLRRAARFDLHCPRCWSSGESPIECTAPLHDNLGAPSNVVSYARGSKATPAWSFSGLTRRRQRDARTAWVREQVAAGLMRKSGGLSDFDLDAAKYIRDNRWTARRDRADADPASPRAPGAH